MTLNELVTKYTGKGVDFNRNNYGEVKENKLI